MGRSPFEVSSDLKFLFPEKERQMSTGRYATEGRRISDTKNTERYIVLMEMNSEQLTNGPRNIDLYKHMLMHCCLTLSMHPLLANVNFNCLREWREKIHTRIEPQRLTFFTSSYFQCSLSLFLFISCFFVYPNWIWINYGPHVRDMVEAAKISYDRVSWTPVTVHILDFFLTKGW